MDVVLLSCAVQVYLQCALLYTTTDGARRVRVSTLALPVSDQMGAVFKGADLDSQLAALTRQVGAWSSGAVSSGQSQPQQRKSVQHVLRPLLAGQAQHGPAVCSARMVVATEQPADRRSCPAPLCLSCAPRWRSTCLAGRSSPPRS